MLEVEVKDRDGDPNGGLAGTAKVKIKVIDVNDNIPVLEKEEVRLWFEYIVVLQVNHKSSVNPQNYIRQFFSDELHM